MEISMHNRDKIIDLFRVIGLLAIILAHVSAPAVIFQLRNFDVVLMVLLTGVSYELSTSKPKNLHQYFSYVYRRFKRLIIPTYFFLIVYFLLANVLNHFNIVTLSFSIEDYVDSFLLLSGQSNTNGIGYVWIMRIYFLTSLLLPFARVISEKLSTKLYLSILLALLILYTLLLNVPVNRCSILGMLFENIILYMFGYGLVAAFGLVICTFTKREYGVGIVIAFEVFLISAFTIKSYTQIAKYPPHIYFFSYAFIVIFSLFYFREVQIMKWLSEKFIVRWISQNSLGIYFMHIIPVKLYECGIICFHWDNFITRYIVVLTITFVLAFIKNAILYYTGRRHR